jgi:hypothetical protein
MKSALVAGLLAIVALPAAQTAKTFAGTISDDVCAKADHTQMQMGSTDAECTTACVSAHGAAYVLYDGENAYRLSGGQPLEQFAGRKVKVLGVLDPKKKTIYVDSIVLAR